MPRSILKDREIRCRFLEVNSRHPCVKRRYERGDLDVNRKFSLVTSGGVPPARTFRGSQPAKSCATQFFPASGASWIF